MHSENQAKPASLRTEFHQKKLRLSHKIKMLPWGPNLNLKLIFATFFHFHTWLIEYFYVGSWSLKSCKVHLALSLCVYLCVYPIYTEMALRNSPWCIFFFPCFTLDGSIFYSSSSLFLCGNLWSLLVHHPSLAALHGSSLTTKS